MRIQSLLALTALFSLWSTTTARAQTDGRGWLDLNAGIARAAEVSYDTEGPVEVAGGTGTFGVTYRVPRGVAFDVGGGYMLTRTFGIGGSVVVAGHRDFPLLRVQVPHPLLPGGASASDGTVAPTEVDRLETSFHLQGIVSLLPPDSSVRLRIFGGPSIIRGSQETVDTIQYNQTAPITGANSVTITSFTFSDSAATGFGFNVGADASYFFGPVIGVGGVVRFSRANLEIEDFSGNHTIKAGGVQVGGGVRLRF